MDLKDEIEALAGRCIHLRSTWRHYEILFHSGEPRRELLHRTAPHFFGDLNQILIEQLVLQICRLTDGRESFGKTNLTIAYLVQRIENLATPAGLDLPRVQALVHSIGQFRSLIEPARNKLISHHDLKAVMADTPLGAASVSAWQQFWDDLEQFLQMIHTAYVDPDGHFMLNDVAMLSDAESLVKALKESTSFHRALADHALAGRIGEIGLDSEFADA